MMEYAKPFMPFAMMPQPGGWRPTWRPGGWFRRGVPPPPPPPPPASVPAVPSTVPPP